MVPHLARSCVLLTLLIVAGLEYQCDAHDSRISSFRNAHGRSKGTNAHRGGGVRKPKPPPKLTVELPNCATKGELEVYLKSERKTVPSHRTAEGGVFLSLQDSDASDDSDGRLFGCLTSSEEPGIPAASKTQDLTIMKEAFLDESRPFFVRINCFNPTAGGSQPISSISSFSRHMIMVDGSDTKYVGYRAAEGKKKVFGFKSEFIGKGCGWSGGQLLSFREKLAKALHAEFIDLQDDSKVTCCESAEPRPITASLRVTYPLVKNDNDMKSWYQSHGYEWLGYGDPENVMFGCESCGGPLDLMEAETTIGHASLGDALAVVSLLSKLNYALHVEELQGKSSLSSGAKAKNRGCRDELVELQNLYFFWPEAMGYTKEIVNAGNLAFSEEALQDTTLFEFLKQQRDQAFDDGSKEACTLLSKSLSPLVYVLGETLQDIWKNLAERGMYVERRHRPIDTMGDSEEPSAFDDNLKADDGEGGGEDPDPSLTGESRFVVGLRDMVTSSRQSSRAHQRLRDAVVADSRLNGKVVAAMEEEDFGSAKPSIKKVRRNLDTLSDHKLVFAIYAEILHDLYAGPFSEELVDVRFDLEKMELDQGPVADAATGYVGVCFLEQDVVIAWNEERQRLLRAFVAFQQSYSQLGFFRKHIHIKQA